MKVAIITITDGANYGNRLQNYALQQVLTSLGVSCETLNRLTSRDPSIIRKVGALIKDTIRFLLHKKTNHIYRVRRKRFKKYNKQSICWSKFTLQKNSAPKELDNEYDFFICGSDQIWNVKFDVIQEDIMNYLASFASPSKRISYAASFGTSSIDKKYIPLFEQELANFKSISVREETGVQLVKSLANREAQLVLDPTMLLTAKEWDCSSKKPDFVSSEEKFIVTYFMSGRNDLLNSHIRHIQQSFECQRVIHLDMEFCDRSSITDEKAFCATPDEFLWLISHSEAVLTDSFHATVFSILFHKPYCVYERKAKEKDNKMSSRIDTLLEYFNMNSFKDDIDNPHIIPQKYNKDSTEHTLEFRRASSISFLQNALSLTKDNEQEEIL